MDTVKIMQQKKPKAEATTYRDAEWENLKFVICISRYCFRLLCRDHSSCIFHVSCGVTNKLVGTYYIDKKCTINARMNVCIDDITFNSTHILYKNSSCCIILVKVALMKLRDVSKGLTLNQFNPFLISFYNIRLMSFSRKAEKNPLKKYKKKYNKFGTCCSRLIFGAFSNNKEIYKLDNTQRTWDMSFEASIRLQHLYLCIIYHKVCSNWMIKNY